MPAPYRRSPFALPKDPSARRTPGVSRCRWQAMPVDVRAARVTDQWHDVADLLFAYQRETAVELDKVPPARPEEVWGPVRHEVINPASAFTTYLIAYEGSHPLGGVGLVAHDAVTVKLTRCYVRPDARRRGVASALVGVAAEQAAQRGVMRLALDILATRETAITAWQRLSFLECEPRGDTAMRYFEYPLAAGGAWAWLGLRRSGLALHHHDPRWATAFLHHAEVVRRALDGQVNRVEHVGSTAVEGLPAKPVVDVAAHLASGVDEAGVITALETRRYVYRGDRKDHGGLLFIAEDQHHRRIVHLHVLRHHDPQWERYVRLRELLRTDEGARRDYAGLKRELVDQFPAERGSYTATKASFIEALLAERSQ